MANDFIFIEDDDYFTKSVIDNMISPATLLNTIVVAKGVEHAVKVICDIFLTLKQEDKAKDMFKILLGQYQELATETAKDCFWELWNKDNFCNMKIYKFVQLLSDNDIEIEPLNS